MHDVGRDGYGKNGNVGSNRDGGHGDDDDDDDDGSAENDGTDFGEGDTRRFATDIAGTLGKIGEALMEMKEVARGRRRRTAKALRLSRSCDEITKEEMKEEEEQVGEDWDQD